MVYFLKNLRLDVRGLRDIKEGIITKGGVCTDEIDPSTMESKLINNLFLLVKLLMLMQILVDIIFKLHFLQLI